MSAKSSKGVSICITKGSATGTAMAATAATKAKPAVITVADVTGLEPGNLIKFAADSTGLESLDGKEFVIANIDDTANTFEVVGSDTTNDTGTFAAGDDMTLYLKDDMVCLCLSTLGFNPESPDSIGVGTFCDPSASLPSAVVSAGTLSYGGYVDIAAPDYQELLLAEADAAERMWRITLPENGYIIFPATIGSLTWQIPLEGAVAYEGQATLGSRPRHLF